MGARSWGVVWLTACTFVHASPQPRVRVVDLNIGQSRTVTLADGTRATVRLIDVRTEHDWVRWAVRQADVLVRVNGRLVTVTCSTYHLPRRVGRVRIDCPVVKSYVQKKGPNANPWALKAEARLRLWPADGPLIEPGTFVYPLKQRWFASDTQMGNEPVFVDRGECPLPVGRSIYYHSGLDFGGAEGMVEVVSAVDGLVVSARNEVLPEHTRNPVKPRADVVYLQDARGWYYRYSHLAAIDPAVQPGRRVRAGQRLGILGKEGASGGWSHLHFAIWARQPSGQWGVVDAYAFVWDAYRRQYQPALLAVARPHQLAWVGEPVTLDGGKSWSAAGEALRYEWTFTDGTHRRD